MSVCLALALFPLIRPSVLGVELRVMHTRKHTYAHAHMAYNISCGCHTCVHAGVSLCALYTHTCLRVCVHQVYMEFQKNPHFVLLKELSTSCTLERFVNRLTTNHSSFTWTRTTTQRPKTTTNLQILAVHVGRVPQVLSP